MSDGLSAPYSKGEPEAQQLGIVLRTSLIAIGFFPVAIVCFLKDFFLFLLLFIRNCDKRFNTKTCALRSLQPRYDTWRCGIFGDGSLMARNTMEGFALCVYDECSLIRQHSY